MLVALAFMLLMTAFLLLALYFRSVNRDVWQAYERLKAELQTLQLQHIHDYREVYGELAGLLMEMGERVPFHAQHGEDIFLWNYFDRKREGYFIEIGAYDGISLSNTFAFENIGWKGLLIEANPDVAEQCRKNRPGGRVIHAAVGAPGHGNSIIFHAVSGEQGDEMLSFINPGSADLTRFQSEGKTIRQIKVPLRTMDSILEEVRPKEIDFVTIDVEGGEMDVLKGFDLARFEPNVVVLENNTGNSDYPVLRYMTQQGYRRFHTLGCNEFYTKEPLAKFFQSTDFGMDKNEG